MISDETYDTRKNRHGNIIALNHYGIDTKDTDMDEQVGRTYVMMEWVCQNNGKITGIYYVLQQNSFSRLFHMVEICSGWDKTRYVSGGGIYGDYH